MSTASTGLVALLGHPVAHSASPAIHSAAFAAAGVDAVYLAFDVAPGELSAAVAGLRALRVLGASATVPHKRAAWEAADSRTAEAELVGAANTLFWEGDALVADNTDAGGLQRVLANDVEIMPGDPVVLFGAGGAARAAAVALARCGAVIEVVARRPSAAAGIADLVRRAGGEIADVVEHPRVVVNATPLGLAGEALPERFMALGPGQVALDLVYGTRDTPFVAAAKAGGATGMDGLGMLLAQASMGFERWTGLTAPIEVMAAAAREALGR